MPTFSVFASLYHRTLPKLRIPEFLSMALSAVNSRGDRFWESRRREEESQRAAELEASRQSQRREVLEALYGVLDRNSSSTGIRDESSGPSASRHGETPRTVDVQELEAMQEVSPRTGPELPTPPASDISGDDEDRSNIETLQAKVDRQLIHITRLEKQLRDERKKQKELEDNRHAACLAEFKAIEHDHREQITRLGTTIKDLGQRLKHSAERERKLKSDLAEGQRLEQELRKQLHEAEMKAQRFESDANAICTAYDRLRGQLNHAELQETQSREHPNDRVRRRQYDSQSIRTTDGNHGFMDSGNGSASCQVSLRHGVSGKKVNPKTAKKYYGYEERHRSGGPRILTSRVKPEQLSRGPNRG